ncbi:uncharacterized protein LOC131433797 [Malaya genurostris]|uniref:uncharacterized protein LOC131433797 n=1 Tax=Malaya genurostris TaxID=325434 RepID=UPI0026F39CA6|nr:uncharacterized protein LOC131433797 [Malaya genurostris]
MSKYIVWKILISLCALNIFSIEGTEKDQKHLEAKPQLYESVSKKDFNHIDKETSGNGQFHLENRGADGISYGCYGYSDSSDRLHITHYVTDARGYRVIQPYQPVQLYTVTANPSAKKSSTETGENRDQHPLRSEQRLWNELQFPDDCYSKEIRSVAIVPAPQKPMPNREPHSCRPDNTAQSNAPAVTSLAPVGGAVGGLLGGLVGGLLQGLGQGLGVNLLATHSCAQNTQTHQCNGGCSKDHPAYLGLMPTIYQPRLSEEHLIRPLETIFSNLLEPRSDQKTLPIYWMLPSSQDGHWRSETGKGLIRNIFPYGYLQQRSLA